MSKSAYIVFFIVLVLSACKKSDDAVDAPFVIIYPPGFPPIESPEGNELTEKRVELGRLLFLDKRLSKDSSVACVSCHLAEHALTDQLALSIGINNRRSLRNSPSLFNVGYHPYFFKDGGIPTLETQVIAPIGDINEMGFSVPGVVERLKDDKIYNELANIAYNRPFDAFVLTRSISAFERTLISGNSKYDQFVQGDSSVFSQSELLGMNLFFSDKTKCSNCHDGINFTDYSFRNNGLYYAYPDTGRERITLDPSDKGKFKVASLRNVEFTAPYMFDGSLTTLEEVIDHYASGGTQHPNQDVLVSGFTLTNDEKINLIAFLKTLSDRAAIRELEKRFQ